MADIFGESTYNRKHERKIYHVDIYFSLEAKAYPAKVQNISRGGALVDSEGFPKVEKGQVILINIPFQKTDQTVKRKARIVWVSDTHFGVEFI